MGGIAVVLLEVIVGGGLGGTVVLFISMIRADAVSLVLPFWLGGVGNTLQSLGAYKHMLLHV